MSDSPEGGPTPTPTPPEGRVAWPQGGPTPTPPAPPRPRPAGLAERLRSLAAADVRTGGPEAAVRPEPAPANSPDGAGPAAPGLWPGRSLSEGVRPPEPTPEVRDVRDVRDVREWAPAPRAMSVPPAQIPLREPTTPSPAAPPPVPLVRVPTATPVPVPRTRVLATPLFPPPEIAALPPLEASGPDGYPFSQRTGEPRRPAVLMVAIAACWLSVAVTIGAFAQWWWRAAHVATFTSSARVLDWAQPDPVSAPAILLVVAIAVISVLMVAATGMVAYNAWAGARWVRIGALVALVVTGLSYLLTWWFMAAIVPLAVAVLLLLLPPVKRFLDAMSAHRAPTPRVVPTSNIRYGPQPLIGAHG